MICHSPLCPPLIRDQNPVALQAANSHSFQRSLAASLSARKASSSQLCRSHSTAYRRHVLLSLVPSIFIPFPARQLTAMAAAGAEDPKNFAYTHLWVSKDGETHIKECRLSGFDLKKYADQPQYIKEGPAPSKIVFSQLDPGLEQDLHCCPQVQFVVCLAGSWYVKTTDGTKKVFVPGDVLFQDNTKECPSAKPPQHYSGVVGSEPNQQMIIQVDFKPEVDHPGPL